MSSVSSTTAGTRSRVWTRKGLIDEALAILKERRMLYKKDGATWFRATDYGDEKDRVVVRENGKKTYFASDIAYHYDKRRRGYDHFIDLLGADHHGYVARVRAGLEAMGYAGDCLEVELVQFVTLYRGGEKMSMSTRSGEFVTLRQLREEVGNDAARFFYVMRSERPAPRLRPGTREEPFQRQPGVLHPVRARTHLQCVPAARGKIVALGSERRRGEPAEAQRSTREGADDDRQPLLGSDRARGNQPCAATPGELPP